MRNLFLSLIISIPFISIAQRDYSKMEIFHSELAPGVHRLFVGNVVTVVAYDGPDGLILIDAAYEQTAPQMRDTINRMFGKPVKYLVNTHLHGDHTGGNIEFGKDAKVIAHQSVRYWLASDRKQGDKVPGPMPDFALPSIFVENTMNLEFNGQTLEMYHLPGGHTTGDIIVYFPVSKVLVLGDLLFADNFPFIDMNNGGNPFTFIKNLKWIVDTFGTANIIVGGHGPVYTVDQLRNYIDTLTQTIDIIADEKEKGKSAEQIKEAKILGRWESYGKFFITEDRWIDTIYPIADKNWQE